MLKHFIRNQGGASLAEYVVILMLLMILTFGVMDMGYALWQWNNAEKAGHGADGQGRQQEARRARQDGEVRAGLPPGDEVRRMSGFDASARDATMSAEV